MKNSAKKDSILTAKDIAKLNNLPEKIREGLKQRIKGTIDGAIAVAEVMADDKKAV